METTATQLRNFVNAATEGRFFTVTFTKQNGQQRVMNCRTGVKRHLKGGKSTTDHKANLLTVYDVQARAYRCINFNTVQRVAMQHKVYTVKGVDDEQ